MKIIIDSNIYLSAGLFNSDFLQRIVSHVRRTNLVIQSQQIIQEVLDVFTRSKEKNKWERISREYHTLSQWGQFYYFNKRDISDAIQIRDHEDRHIIQLAQLSEADYILTGDKDLLDSKYKEMIISPAEYFNQYM